MAKLPNLNTRQNFFNNLLVRIHRRSSYLNWTALHHYQSAPPKNIYFHRQNFPPKSFYFLRQFPSSKISIFVVSLHTTIKICLIHPFWTAWIVWVVRVNPFFCCLVRKSLVGVLCQRIFFIFRKSIFVRIVVFVKIFFICVISPVAASWLVL